MSIQLLRSRRLARPLAGNSLDVFGMHALGGIFGALRTGIFKAPFLGGPGSPDYVTGAATDPGVLTQFLIQLRAVCLVVVWTAVLALAGFQRVRRLVGLRVPEKAEREGLDITAHGERAYDL
jgi:ammonium transporter, Amt family